MPTSLICAVALLPSFVLILTLHCRLSSLSVARSASPDACLQVPSLPIFLAQGPMNNVDPLTTCLQNVATAVNAAGGSVHYLDLRFATQDGCGNHPGPLGHAQMAAKAQPQIAAVLGW